MVNGLKFKSRIKKALKATPKKADIEKFVTGDRVKPEKAKPKGIFNVEDLFFK